MYKTVRHGENSLQYTILPQEDGIVNVKPRKSRKKGKTAAILTVTVLLICSIIATAVLVPLLLKSDLLILPAAFQKFSVSSLHRSHSGNHVVVVAKKPHGWINSHHNPAHPPNKTHSISSTNNAYKSQDEAMNMQVKTTTTTTSTTLPTTRILPTTTTTSSTTTTTTEKASTAASSEVETNNVGDKKTDENVLWAYEHKYAELPGRRNYLDVTTTTTKSLKSGESVGGGVVRLLNPNIPTTSSPWYNQRWSFGNTVSYVSWSGDNAEGSNNSKSITGGVGILLLCLTIILITLLVRRRRLKKSAIKNSADAKADDKDTLLKESTAGSEEE